MRETFAKVRESLIPQRLGICPSDTARLAAAVNDAQQRLVYAGREAGWWQGWVRVRFYVSTAYPYLTLPREFARIINMAVGELPIYVHNEFYEVLPGGIGPIPDPEVKDWCGTVAGYERGVFPTTIDLPTSNQKLRVYITDPRDVGARMLFSGLDQNATEIYSTDGLNTVGGFYLVFNTPFTDSDFIVTKINLVQKPITYGDVVLQAIDQTTGEATTLSRYLASETTPAYRRYYIAPLPSTCCQTPNGPVFNITAIAKQEFIPAIRDTDPLVISNMPALLEMVQACRYFGQDVVASHALGEKHEKRAIRLMKQELDHYIGRENPAVAVDSMQGASLCRLGLSTNI